MKKRTVLILGSIFMSILLIGCAELKQSEKMKNILSGEISKGEDVYVEDKITKDLFEVHSVNDELKLELYEVGDTSDQSFIKYKVKRAQLCSSLEETGIEKEQIETVDCYEYGEPFTVTAEDIEEMNIVVCDVEIQSMQGNKEISVDLFDIVNESEDGALYQMGFPIYFSHHMEDLDGSKYYHFIVTEEPVVCKIAWAVRSKFAEKHELFLCSGYDAANKYKYLIPVEK